MTTSFALKIFFEIGLVLLIVYGYMNEDRLIAFEAELFALLRFMFKKYVLKRNVKKAPSRRQVNTVKANRTPVNRASAPRKSAEIRTFPVSNMERHVA